MSVDTELTRAAQNAASVDAAKSAIASAITAKGGTVGASDGLENFPAAIAGIPSGGTTLYWQTSANSAARGHIYIADMVLPDSLTASDGYRGCNNLNSLTMPSVSSMPTYCVYDTSCKYVYAPKCTNLSSARCLGRAFLLEECEIGSVGYGVSSSVSTVFYQMESVGFVGIFYTTGDYLDTLKSNIRNQATQATLIFKASEDTEYNGVAYAAGETILTSEP